MSDVRENITEETQLFPNVVFEYSLVIKNIHSRKIDSRSPKVTHVNHRNTLCVLY